MTRDPHREEIAEKQFQEAVAQAVANPTAAIRLLKKAAAIGHPAALVNLGSYYRDGHGVRSDWRKARQFFEKAAKMGSPHGMTSLARLLLERGTTSAEHRRACDLLKMALRKGDTVAAHFLGRAAEERGQWREAERWFRIALNDGDVTSGLRIARHYLDSMKAESQARGVVVLREILRRSEVDAAWAFTELGKCYLHGHGVPRSRARALKYLEQAAPTDSEARHLLEILKPAQPDGLDI